MKVSVVVPCYNEAAIIFRNYIRIKEALQQQRHSHEILIANDGSTDGSVMELRRIQDLDPNFVLIDYCPNRGMGYACRQLFARAQGDVVIEMDADLAMDPAETVPLFLRHLEDNVCVVASRYRGIAAEYPLRRRLPSRIYYLINQLLFSLPLKDATSGFFAIRRSALQSVELKSDGFELHVELFAQLVRKGYKLLEVPVRFVHQTATGEVSVLRAAPRMLINTLKIYRRLSLGPRASRPQQS